MKNTTKPESTLNKKSNAVLLPCMTHIPGAENPADLMKKVLSGSEHQYLVQHLLLDIQNDSMFIHSANECITHVLIL